ncbi:hypothetical protein HJC23_011846 [Cyclotella cryptica]|uniref:PDZ domain-containing protein n=1 Tax=Cyclotella cryptica TaxID=29204 RepID=A0ABD3QEM0_9STRA|eukprot:CCRYP_006128-RB/>CCRYP_006128-RB protein AED:0.09 eAED:0.09 QI:315/1/1/1/0.5/0.33/3/787/623
MRAQVTMRPTLSLLIALYLQSSSTRCNAKKVVLHEVKEKSLLYTRSFNALAGGRSGSGRTKSSRINFNASDTGDSSGGVDGEDDIFESENETTTSTTPSSSINALTVGITNATNTSSSNEDHISPFLSTTLRVTLLPVPTSTLSTFDDDKQSLFGEAYTNFVEHVLNAQEVYDVQVLAVSVFDEELLPLHEVETDGVRRGLLTNGLQFSFHNENENKDDYDDAYDDGVSTNEDDDASKASAVSGKSTQVSAEQTDQPVYSSLRFGIIISAEHTSEPTDATYLSNEQFQKIILHISNKFHSHLLEYVSDADLYFRYVQSVNVETYALDSGAGTFESEAISSPKQGLFKRMENEMKSVEGESLNTWSIVAIVVGGLAFVGLIFATVKFYKREKTLQRNRWRSQEIAHSNANASTAKSLRVLYNKQPIQDDYSFDPMGADLCQNEYSSTQQHRASTKEQIQRLFEGYTDVPLHGNRNTEEEISFSRWPKVAPEAPSPLFPGAPPAPAACSAASSFDEERITPANSLYNLPRQHVYAPPGKVGVAIDIQDGQPIVHKVKKGSPLEGLLQPKDIVVAIDDVDTNCMSAADVTHLMVKVCFIIDCLHWFACTRRIINSALFQLCVDFLS